MSLGPSRLRRRKPFNKSAVDGAKRNKILANAATLSPLPLKSRGHVFLCDQSCPD